MNALACDCTISERAQEGAADAWPRQGAWERLAFESRAELGPSGAPEEGQGAAARQVPGRAGGSAALTFSTPGTGGLDPAQLQAAELHGWNFRLPAELQAAEPPEARGLERDEVRLMVSERSTDRITHTTFRDLPCYLDPGDLLVINTSATLNAALPATGPTGQQLELHLSTHLPGGLWSVELRRPGAHGTEPYYLANAGETYHLPGGGSATLLALYGTGDPSRRQPHKRLWLAALELPLALNDYLAHHGFPIHYGYVPQTWPAEYYQTVYTTEPGSAEMPSAGRAFTPEVITQALARGIWLAPLVLHTGVASLEEDELPYEEFYRVPSETAYLINAARARGKRVIAVGTTVVRAVETVTDPDGTTHPGEGWTGLVVTPGYRLRAISGLLTGLHEPRSTHLAMLEALAGREHLRLTYAEALRERYLWHEFGDLHLIL